MSLLGEPVCTCNRLFTYEDFLWSDCFTDHIWSDGAIGCDTHWVECDFFFCVCIRLHMCLHFSVNSTITCSYHVTSLFLTYTCDNS